MKLKIKITDNDIRYMVNECIRKVIVEGASSILYHWINIEYLYDILKSNRFKTCEPEMNSASYYDNRNDGYIDGKDQRFISLTRNGNPSEGYPILKYGEFGDGEISCMCRITIDGDLLTKYCNFYDEEGKRHNIKVRPMDWAHDDGISYEHGATNGKTWMMYSNSETYDNNYAYDNMGSSNDIHLNYYSDKYHHPYSQAEDRLTTTAKYIPNANRYIKRIDIYFRNGEEYEEELKEVAKYINGIKRLSKKLSIPLYIHNNIKTMLPYNTNK